MIAHKMDLFALHEIVMARAVPKPTPTFAAFLERDVESLMVSGPSWGLCLAVGRARGALRRTRSYSGRGSVEACAETATHRPPSRTYTSVYRLRLRYARPWNRPVCSNQPVRMAVPP